MYEKSKWRFWPKVLKLYILYIYFQISKKECSKLDVVIYENCWLELAHRTRNEVTKKKRKKVSFVAIHTNINRINFLRRSFCLLLWLLWHKKATSVCGQWLLGFSGSRASFSFSPPSSSRGAIHVCYCSVCTGGGGGALGTLLNAVRHVRAVRWHHPLVDPLYIPVTVTVLCVYVYYISCHFYCTESHRFNH